MSEKITSKPPVSWSSRRNEKARRMQAVSSWMNGPILRHEKTVAALEAVLSAGDTIVLEGDTEAGRLPVTFAC